MSEECSAGHSLGPRGACRMCYNAAYYKVQGEKREVDTTLLNPITYSYAHKKVMRARGRAVEHTCVDCGEQAEQWSYNGHDVYEQTGQRVQCTRTGETTVFTMSWSPNVWAYSARCAPCHHSYDKG